MAQDSEQAVTGVDAGGGDVDRSRYVEMGDGGDFTMMSYLLDIMNTPATHRKLRRIFTPNCILATCPSVYAFNAPYITTFRVPARRRFFPQRREHSS